MSIQYFGSSKSVAIIPQNEDGRYRSFIQGTPAYSMIMKILKSSQEDKEQQLRFFTQYGHKKVLGGMTIESTPSDCFNVYLGEKVFTSYPSYYMQIIEAIDNGNESNLKFVLEEISKDIVNINLITSFFPKAIIEEREIIVNGKFGIWLLNRETLRCSLNGKFVCIVFKEKYNKNPEFTEKEEMILSKLLAISNDELYYNSDTIIKLQIDRILG